MFGKKTAQKMKFSIKDFNQIRAIKSAGNCVTESAENYHHSVSCFLIIQERSYSSAIFLQRQSFQNIWKKKIQFFAQCVMKLVKTLRLHGFP